MTPQERVDTNIIQYYEPWLKYKTKDELLSNFKSAGVDISVLKGTRVDELQDIRRKKYLSITKIIRKERVKVYMGNPKGLLQVLWECVFINTSKYVCTY